MACSSCSLILNSTLKNNVVMIASAKVDWRQIFSEVTKVRYLGHIIRDDLRDDDDDDAPLW